MQWHKMELRERNWLEFCAGAKTKHPKDDAQRATGGERKLTSRVGSLANAKEDN
jgi:hypothetical protein